MHSKSHIIAITVKHGKGSIGVSRQTIMVDFPCTGIMSKTLPYQKIRIKFILQFVYSESHIFYK